MTDPVVERLFRQNHGRLVAVLTRLFGPAHLGLAEDVAQEAMLKALEVWPARGVPDNPLGWLTRVAKNHAINLLKRERLLITKADQIVDVFELGRDTSLLEPAPDSAADSVMQLVFVACHPELSPESRIALTLKTVAGFSVEQIGRALLAEPAAIYQRITRAKRQIAQLGLAFELPTPAEIPARLDSVLEVLYLMFNEGHGELRRDLADEAIRLCRLLADRPETAQPKVDALLALLQLHAARFPARAGGDIVMFDLQDRSAWDRGLIADGLLRLAASARGDVVSSYHLEAGIAACHAIAPDLAGTDWPRIVELYDQLLALTASPIVALNRAIGIAMRDGPADGLRALDALRDDPALQRYHLYWAALAKLQAAVGARVAARSSYGKALACPCSPAERRFLERGLAAVSSSRAVDCQQDVDPTS